MKSTIYITNWLSQRPHHGPGRKLSISTSPYYWEVGDGRVVALIPDGDDLKKLKAGRMSLKIYKAGYLGQLDGLEDTDRLRPERLLAELPDGRTDYVRDGDTLCCSCSHDVAVRGECHHVWAAERLREAGWRVVLDGLEI